MHLSQEEQDELEPVFSSVTPKGEAGYYVTFEDLGENAQPMVITQNEFMRRMKDMSAIQPGMNMYGNMPDSYNLVVNVSHPLVKEVIEAKNKSLGSEFAPINEKLKSLNNEIGALEKLKEGKKDDEIAQEEKDKLNEVTKESQNLALLS